MTQDEAIRKAMGCLRLAKSSNQAEAALAAAKAQEIIDKYKLDVTGLDYDKQEDARDKEQIKDFGNDPLADVDRSITKWKAVLASAIARQNQCKIYLSHFGDRQKRVNIIGRPSDVATVRYLFGFLQNEVIRLRDENTVGQSATFKYQYCDGVVDTIQTKLHEQHMETVKAAKAEHASNSLALVRVNTALAKQEQRAAQVEKWVEDNMRLKAGTRSAGPRNWSGGREAGRRDGHNVRFGQAKGSVGRGNAGYIE